jgi:hypothetical protein
VHQIPEREQHAAVLSAVWGGVMFTITEEALIARSPEDVFDFLTDGRNRPLWDRQVISEELTSPGPVGVGSTIHTRMRTMGGETDFDWRVTRFARPTHMAIVSTTGILATAFAFRFAAVGDGCRVSATVEGSPTGMMRLAEPLIAESVRSNLAAGLARAQAVLEARPGR